MNLIRWEPQDELLYLHHAMNRLFDDFLSVDPWGPPATGVPFNLIERDKEFILRAQIPGFDQAQLDISLQGDLLTIKGQQEEKTEEKQAHVHRHEYHATSFQRSIRLPASVDVDSSKAEYKNGILSIHLPKEKPSITKQIPILNKLSSALARYLPSLPTMKQLTGPERKRLTVSNEPINKTAA